MAIDVSLSGAAVAGLVSFLSPCVLPLVPPYLCYMAGVSLDQLTGKGDAQVAKRTVLAASISFVLGFSTVFIALGAAASAVGQLVRSHIDVLSVVGGVVIIVMGLHFLGVFRIAFLSREARVQVTNQAAGPLGAYVMGLAFAFGWTPCIGPVLAAILAVAGSEQTVTPRRAAACRLFARPRHSLHRRRPVLRAVPRLHAPLPRPSRHGREGHGRAPGGHRRAVHHRRHGHRLLLAAGDLSGLSNIG